MTQVRYGSDKQLLLRNMLNQPGGDPTYIMNMLFDVVSTEVWTEWTDVDGRKFGTFSKALEHMGQSKEKVEHLIEIKHSGELRGDPAVIERMKWLRETVTALFAEELPTGLTRSEAGSLGGRGNKAPDVSDALGDKQYGNSRIYWIQRLKRDKPEIAERLIHEPDFTVKQAKEAAGIQPPPGRPRIDLSSPESVAQTLLQYMQPEDIAALLALLAEAIHTRA